MQAQTWYSVRGEKISVHVARTYIRRLLHQNGLLNAQVWHRLHYPRLRFTPSV